MSPRAPGFHAVSPRRQTLIRHMDRTKASGSPCRRQNQHASKINPTVATMGDILSKACQRRDVPHEPMPTSVSSCTCGADYEGLECEPAVHRRSCPCSERCWVTRDGKYRSDDTVSIEEFDEYIHGCKLLDRTSHHDELRLRSEISAPIIAGTVAADMSSMDIRQELFQSGEGMLTDADSSGSHLSSQIGQFF